MMPIVLKMNCTDTTRLRRGKDHFWKVILDLSRGGAAFKYTDVVGFCDHGQQSPVTNFLRELCLAGIASRNVDLTKQEYSLNKRQRRRPVTDEAGNLTAGGLAGKRRQNMWNVMRRNKAGWTVLELAVAASTDDVSVTKDTAYKYSHALFKAGCLNKVDAKINGCIHYRLKGSADTGPQCPIVVAGSAVFDQNTEKLVCELFLTQVAS